MSFRVRSKHPRSVYLAGRKFAHGGKGQTLSESELKALVELKDGGVEVGRLAFTSGVLELVDEENGKALSVEDFEALFPEEQPAG